MPKFTTDDMKMKKILMKEMLVIKILMKKVF